MDFVAVVDQVMALLRQRGRVAYRTLKRQFQLDDEAIEDLKIELIDSQRLATDEQGTVLVWTGAAAAPPEAAQQLLDPALQIMMDAVHRYEGTVNQVLGDGIMALFGAPLAHEDHAVRACYAALAM